MHQGVPRIENGAYRSWLEATLISYFKWERHLAAINSATDNPPEADHWAF
jgi:hypothetical protein